MPGTDPKPREIRISVRQALLSSLISTDLYHNIPKPSKFQQPTHAGYVGQPQRPAGGFSRGILSPKQSSQESYLNELYLFLRHNKYLEPFMQNLLDLKNVWAILANEREEIADLGQGQRYTQNLSEWIFTGISSEIANRMSGIISLPLLVIIQTCQYFQYLEIHGMSHSQLMTQLRAGGGIQGYRGGLLPAIAIAYSKTEVEVAENAAVAARTALAIGAYGELGDDESIPGQRPLLFA
ncbi:MAG: hypothetical protein Q9163_000210 [Psora crenata]